MTFALDGCQPTDSRPGRADTAPADLLEAATTRLFDLEQRQAAKMLLPVVTRHLDVIAAALSSAGNEHEQHQLTLIHGDAAALAGWLLFDREDGRGAHHHWDMALTAAEQACSGSLLACVQTYMSYAAAERGDHTAAWQLAHTALSHAGDDNWVRAWMSARAAQAAAELGEQGAAFTSLDLAIELGHDLKSTTPEGTTPPWARFVDSAYIWGMVANTFSHMKITSDAFMAAIYAKDALTEGETKARALTLAEIAYAFAAVWQLDEAVWYATEAVGLAEKLEATQAMRRLRAMVSLLPGSFSREAKALVERVTVN